MRRYLSIGALVCSIVAVTAHACLWDRDTLAAEARGLPGITEVITGRFDRFPPLFYEMRLERVAAEVEADADRLDLYDDAGVACDRLGRSDEAIAWMGQKLVVLERLESEGVDVSEHRYRYLANLGTFYIHRWLKGGQDREDMGDVERARELIAAAIELNPEAHFGRERYQLLAIEWVLDPPRGEDTGRTFLHTIPGYSRYEYGTRNFELAAMGYPDAARGISGLIALGAAWESADIFYALAFALGDRNDASTALVAMNRARELAGKGTHTQLLEPENYRLDRTPGARSIRDDQSRAINRWYIEARLEADSWVQRRNQYLSVRLEQGLHPDISAEFWGDWAETTSAPTLPGTGYRVFIYSVGLTVLALFGFLIYRVKLDRSKRSIIKT
ncbi:MAG: hypothetical protein AB8C13_11000 [Phycisphaerales bacterium]